LNLLIISLLIINNWMLQSVTVKAFMRSLFRYDYSFTAIRMNNKNINFECIRDEKEEGF
jgi:hypothetical protein